MSRNNSPDKATLEKLAGVSERNADLLGSCDELGKKRHKHGAKGFYACHYCNAEILNGCVSCLACNHTPKLKIFWDSRGEYKRYLELLMYEKAGIIENLQRQFPIDIFINDVSVGVYLCDFIYNVRKEDDQKINIVLNQDEGMSIVTVFEDFKGWDNPLSKFKRKCVEASRGIKITLTRSNHERSRQTRQS